MKRVKYAPYLKILGTNQLQLSRDISITQRVEDVIPYDEYQRPKERQLCGLIIDLSEHEKGKGRKLSAHPIAPEEAVTLEAIEHTVREFLTALNLVGISQPIPPIDNVIDLFRPPT